MIGYRASGFLFLLINGFAFHGSGLVGLGLRVAGLTWISQNQGGGRLFYPETPVSLNSGIYLAL